MADINENGVLYNASKAYKNGQEYLFDWTMLAEYNSLASDYASLVSDVASAQANLRTSIQNKGVTVPANAPLSSYYSYVDQIKSAQVPPLSSTGNITYGGMYTCGYYQDMMALDMCASYLEGDIVLIGYMGAWQTYDNYDQKDIHFMRWKPGQARKESTTTYGDDYRYTFNSVSVSITRENNGASFLMSAKARYSRYPNDDDWYLCQMRYTVSNDTFTTVTNTNMISSTDPWPDIVNDDMHLYTASYEIQAQTRVALFTLN